MANSVQQNRQGPFWPLGSIVVVTPGTPVNIMSLVDPGNVNAPNSATSATSNEYTPRCQQIMFMGYQLGPGSHGLQANAGNVYLIQKGGAGSNNRDDTGSIIKVLVPGETFFLSSASMNRDVFSPYTFWLDADNAADAAQVSLIVQ